MRLAPWVFTFPPTQVSQERQRFLPLATITSLADAVAAAKIEMFIQRAKSPEDGAARLPRPSPSHGPLAFSFPVSSRSLYVFVRVPFRNPHLLSRRLLHFTVRSCAVRIMHSCVAVGRFSFVEAELPAPVDGLSPVQIAVMHGWPQSFRLLMEGYTQAIVNLGFAPEPGALLPMQVEMAAHACMHI